MHAGTLDVIKRRNRARQFAFQTTAIARGFHELAGPQALILVENLEADVGVLLDHACRGELNARPLHVIGLDQQRTGVGLHGVGNVGGCQGVHDLLGVQAGKTAVQRTVIGLLRPEHHGKANRHAGGEADHKADLTQHGHLGKIVQESQTEHGRLARWGACLGRNAIGECFCHDSICP